MGSTPSDVYTSGNAYQGLAQQALNGTAPQWNTPNVQTMNVSNIDQVRQKAGCQPRDAIDQAYITTTTGWLTKDGAPFRP